MSRIDRIGGESTHPLVAKPDVRHRGANLRLPRRNSPEYMPAAKFWVLDDFLPTGEIRLVDDRLDFRKGQSMAGLKLDDVLTDLEFTADRGVCRLIDEAKNAEFLFGFDRGFRELVLYTPPGRGDVISLEP